MITNDNELEAQISGQADWDTGLNGNVQILEQGFHLKLTAGAAISSGQICLINSGSLVIPYDSRSVSNRQAHVMAYRAVNSGEVARFIREGVVRSMTVWSGAIVPGEPVFVSPASLGFAVSSYTGAGYAAGLAVGVDAVYFRPGAFRVTPDRVTQTLSFGPVLVGSPLDFSIPLGQRGLVVSLRVTAQSADAYKVRFHSNSTRVDSELEYNTLTRSLAAGSTDVNTLSYFDAAPWSHNNTNGNSLGLIYGRVEVQSASSVASSNFSVDMIMERFR